MRFVSTDVRHCSSSTSSNAAGRAEHAGVVEQQVDAAPLGEDTLEQRVHGLGVGDVGRDDERAIRGSGGGGQRLAQRLLTTPGERHAISRAHSPSVTARPIPDPAPVTTATPSLTRTCSHPRA